MRPATAALLRQLDRYRAAVRALRLHGRTPETMGRHTAALARLNVAVADWRASPGEDDERTRLRLTAAVDQTNAGIACVQAMNRAAPR